MSWRAAIPVLFLLVVRLAVPQSTESQSHPDTALRSISRVVQLDVLVIDTDGRAVHGLQQEDFAVTDNGRPRSIQIFAGEIDADRTASSTATAPQGSFSNRFHLNTSRIATAMVIDAILRPDGLQQEAGIFPPRPPDGMIALVRGQARHAISRLAPGQTMAIYAVCPELRVVQDYTSDPDRLLESLNSFVVPHASNATGRKQPRTIEELVTPMLSALREIAKRMSESSGRKSIVWISQAYGTGLNREMVKGLGEETVAALNEVNVPLYAVDARFNPTCQYTYPAMNPRERGMATRYPLCFQPRDTSDEWMEWLALATGGRAFSAGTVDAVSSEVRDNDGRMTSGLGSYQLSRGAGAIGEAFRLALDDSRDSYELGFYVPESELDGTLHTLGVKVPSKPKYGLRYRSGYTASASVTGPPSLREQTRPSPVGKFNSDEVGIDAMLDIAPTEHELRVSLSLDPETVTRAANNTVIIDETFTETDGSGKPIAKIRETVPVASFAQRDGMIRYIRSVKLAKGAVLLHITIRDQATKRVGSLIIPIVR